MADNFALVARLIVVFLALAAVLPERVAGLVPRRFAHLAFCAAAIFLFTDALMVRFFVESPAELLDTPRMRPSSFAELLDSFFDRGSPFKLIDGQVVYVHVASKYSKANRNQGSKTLICANGDRTDVCVGIC